MFIRKEFGFISLLFVLVFYLICIHNVRAQYGQMCNLNSTTSGVCVPEKSCSPNYSTSEEKEGRIALCSNDDNELICCSHDNIHLNPDGLAMLKENAECGDFNINRIAHGDNAHLLNFRWMALLKYKDDINPFRCGGSVISKRFVLTAAHCVYKRQRILTEVRLGEYDLSTEKDCLFTRRGSTCLSPYEDIAIEKHILHEDYKFGLHHDIALLKLVRDVNFADHIQPICLPTSRALIDEQSTHDYYVVSGWGRTENSTAARSDVLKFTGIVIHPNDFCYENLKLRLFGKLTSGHICAGGQNRQDSCKGDSGGPIFRTSINYDGLPRAVQFGIVSLGVKTCGEETKPAIYTNVSFYMQWITDHMVL